MTKIYGDVDKFYNDTYYNINNAKTDFSYISSINSGISIYHTFEEKANLENFMSDCNNMCRELDSLLSWVESLKKSVESNVDNLTSEASSLPYREISSRKGLL